MLEYNQTCILKERINSFEVLFDSIFLFQYADLLLSMFNHVSSVRL